MIQTYSTYTHTKEVDVPFLQKTPKTSAHALAKGAGFLTKNMWFQSKPNAVEYRNMFESITWWFQHVSECFNPKSGTSFITVERHLEVLVWTCMEHRQIKREHLWLPQSRYKT